VGKQGVVLKNHAQVALVDRGVVDAFAFDENIAFGGLLQAGHHAQQGGLAASGRAQQGHQAAFLDVKIHFFDSHDFAESF
jgi:hypothetical protein